MINILTCISSVVSSWSHIRFNNWWVMISINQVHLKSHRTKSQPKMRLCLFWCPTQLHIGSCMRRRPGPCWVRDPTAPNSTLGYDAFVPDHSRIQSQAEPNSYWKSVWILNLTLLRLSAWLKYISTLSLSYSRFGLVIMIPITSY
jgi:hypothetical protein